MFGLSARAFDVWAVCKSRLGDEVWRLLSGLYDPCACLFHLCGSSPATAQVWELFVDAGHSVMFSLSMSKSVMSGMLEQSQVGAGCPAQPCACLLGNPLRYTPPESLGVAFS